jgi:hypothetical protein
MNRRSFFFPPKQRLAQPSGVDLADQIAVRGIAAHVVFRRSRPTHRAPDVAIDVGADTVGHARREAVGEYASIAQPRAIHIESADVRWPAMRDA